MIKIPNLAYLLQLHLETMRGSRCGVTMQDLIDQGALNRESARVLGYHVDDPPDSGSSGKHTLH